MTKKKSEVDDVIDTVGRIIPDGVNRRHFFKTAVGATFGVGLAGCTGGGGGDGDDGGSSPSSGGTGSDSTPDDEDLLLVENATFRNTWKTEPDWAQPFTARRKGFWREAGIHPPAVQEGYGSGDTAKRLATGTDTVGNGSIIPYTEGLRQEGFDVIAIGGARLRPDNALIWRMDSMDSHEDLAGKTVIVGSSFEQQTLQFFLEIIGVSVDEITVTTANESTSLSLIAEGEADASWGTMGNIPAIVSALEGTDVEVNAKSWYSLQEQYQMLMWVNKSWLNQDDMHKEWCTRLLTGYSAATKWMMENPAELVDFMRQEVNPTLQAQERETQIETMGAFIGENLTEGARENGLLWLDPEVLDRSFDIASSALGVQKPSLDERFSADIQSQADLTTISESEYDSMMDAGAPWTYMYDGDTYQEALER